MVQRFYIKISSHFEEKLRCDYVFFPNLDFIFNPENQRHGFIFTWNDLKFFV